MTKKHTRRKPRAARHTSPRGAAGVTSEKPADGSVLAMKASRTLRSSGATEKHAAPADANDAHGDTQQAATLRDRVRAIVTSRLARLVTTATGFLPSAPRAFVRDHLHLEG